MDLRDLIGFPKEFLTPYDFYIIQEDDMRFPKPDVLPTLCVTIKEGKIYDIKVRKGGDPVSGYENIW